MKRSCWIPIALLMTAVAIATPAAATPPEDAYKLFVRHQWQGAWNILKPYRQANAGYAAKMVPVDFMLGVTACQLGSRPWGQKQLQSMLTWYPKLTKSQADDVRWHVQNCGTQMQAAVARVAGKEDARDYIALASPR